MKQIAWRLEVEKGFNVLQCIYNEKNESITDEEQKHLVAAHYKKIDEKDNIKQFSWESIVDKINEMI